MRVNRSVGPSPDQISAVIKVLEKLQRAEMMKVAGGCSCCGSPPGTRPPWLPERRRHPR
jgi:hypothetical protein